MSTTTARYLNVAGYQFVTLDRLHERRRALRQWCQELDLCGTILLAGEGINLFLAGLPAAIEEFLGRLRGDARLQGFAVKRSYSDDRPFRRTLVRLKKEIIAFGVPEIDPRRATSRRVTPRQLQQWLAAGESVTLLDVRNDYEVELGTFREAIPIGVAHFRQFPAAARQLPAALKKQRVVTFCTGGIRCEKAAPYLEQIGFEDVYQLDGGILQYFEDCGNDFYEGDCFVFDRRVAVDPRLSETSAALCFACQAALTEAEQQSPLYVPGESCPHCYQEPAARMQQCIESRHAKLAAVTQPLPGSVPYENRRPLHVTPRFQGLTLLAFLRQLHPHVPAQEWIDVGRSGLLLWQGQPASLDRIVTAGEQYWRVLPDTVEPAVAADVRIIYEDDWLVAVDKPAPLPMHPCGRFNRNTLSHILNAVYRPLRLRAAHRLDANTSGVVLLSKTRKVASQVQPQFEQGTVEKQYLARVHGQPTSDWFESRAAIGTERTVAGARQVDPHGLPAHTEFQVVARLDDGTTLLGVVPHTGRTNQIRIHLWDLGWPIVNDPLYLCGRQLGQRHTLEVDEPQLCLQAQRLTCSHPVSQQRMTVEVPPRAWAEF